MNPDELASLTLEHLRAIRAGLDELGNELAVIRLELGDPAHWWQKRQTPISRAGRGFSV